MRAAAPEPRPIRVTLVPVQGEKPGRPATAAPGVPSLPTPRRAERRAATSPVARKAPPKAAAPRASTPTQEPIEAEAPAPAVAAAPPSAAAATDASAAPGAPGAGRSDGRRAGAGNGAASGADRGELGDRVARYVEDVRRRIADRQRYPAAAKLRGVEGIVTVVLAIGIDGRLESMVLEGDANALLARSAQEATQAAAPFGPPPGGARRIRVPVRYALR